MQKLTDKKAAKNRSKRISGKYFRLIIPALADYGTKWSYKDDAIKNLRSTTVDHLMLKQKKRGLKHYLVAVERHPGSKLPHLDILLIYSKRIFNTFNRYDYIIKHGSLTKYRTLNKAILEYSLKEDPNPLLNFDVKHLLVKSKVKTDLYSMMYNAMAIKPFEFDAIEWITNNNLGSEAIKTNLFKIIRLIKEQQKKLCNNLLRNKPGIQFITPELIKKTLSEEEFKLFKSWSGYQTIIDHINQIPTYGYNRPHKTKNLFLTGPPNTGKSTLARELSKYCSSYPLGTKGGWFPNFKSKVYKFLIWDEFDLKCYSYTDLLKLLEGAPMKLPIKGGHAQRADNQLIICTSNLTIDEHIINRFKSFTNRQHSFANLGVRFTEVHIPKTKPLFLLYKLFFSLEL